MANIDISMIQPVVRKNVIVIGAGVAGLFAAMQLKKNGFTNVQVLEARDYHGGRAKTINYESGYLEMGAQWIHGEVGNLIYEIAKDNNLIDDCAPNYMEKCTKSPKSAVCKDKDLLIHEIMEVFDSVVEANNTDDSTDSLNETKFLSLAQYIERNCYNYLEEGDNQIKDIKHTVLSWYVSLQREINGCEDLNLLSAKLLRCYTECEGNPCVELKQGYSSVLKIILDQIPSDWISFNKIVNLINYNNEDTIVTVTCEDNSSFIADYVIITLPVGYLKKNSDSLFCPALPLQKKKAIECMGFGVINKVYLEFDIPFWTTGDIFKVFWTSSLDDNFKQEHINSWCKDINRFSYVLHQPKILCAWVNGKGASTMEKLTDEQIINDCHWLLNNLLVIENLQKPCKILRSCWYSDKFSCGSYSFLSLNNEKENCGPADLAMPIIKTRQCGLHPSLLFAGEGTHSSFYSTVHGAAESGIREANRIAAHSKYHELMGVMKSDPKQAQILIIGAGTAGLNCALHCINSGIKDIIILEALDRIGGRIYTMDFGKSVLEIGAQWIHGEKTVLFDYCKEFDLVEEDECSFEGKGNFYMTDGNIIPQNIVNETFEFLEATKNSFSMYNHNAIKPLGRVFEDAFRDYLMHCDDKPEIKAYKRGLFDWFKKFEIVDNGCDSLEDLCPLTFVAWKDCPGLYHIDLKKGFSSYIETLENKIPESCILKSKPVKCIHWQKNIFKINDYKSEKQIKSDFPVFLECENGEWFAAQTVIVTSSIGFLKENINSFFKPPLTNNKKKILSEISYGTANKIFLVFEKAFWNKDDLGFQLIWTDDCFKEKYCSVKDDWVFGITGFDRVRNQPNVLLAWIGGVPAKKMENIEPFVIGETCAEILRQFLNKPDIPSPIEVIRSSWNENPYIKGSYSSRPTQFFTSECDIKDLQEPLYSNVTLHTGLATKWPTIIFAGEACDPEGFSSVHGAMQSGISAANIITSFYKNL